jgi:hypothetical protein
MDKNKGGVCGEYRRSSRVALRAVVLDVRSLRLWRERVL